MNLKGKKFLITGAAGRIGYQVAKACLKGGADLVLADIKTDLLEAKETTNELDALKGNYFTLKIDLSKSSNLDKLILFCEKVLGKLDGAVHSAYPTSQYWGARLENLKEKDLFLNLNLQLGGAIFFSQKIINYFEKNGGGNLIHISSIQGLGAPKFEHYEGTSMHSPIEYTAIKAGIIGITKWLAKYYKNKNIRVNCISPGGIIDNQPDIFMKRYRASCTNFGMLKSNQVCDTILFLLSSSSEAINGQNIIIDDGWSL